MKKSKIAGIVFLCMGIFLLFFGVLFFVLLPNNSKQKDEKYSYSDALNFLVDKTNRSADEFLFVGVDDNGSYLFSLSNADDVTYVVHMEDDYYSISVK